MPFTQKCHTHTRNARPAVLSVFTTLSGLCPQNEMCVHGVKACAGCVAVLLLHTELLHVDFQLISSPESVCDCSAGSLSLGRGLSSWCYRAFFPQERVGFFLSGWDVWC